MSDLCAVYSNLLHSFRILHPCKIQTFFSLARQLDPWDFEYEFEQIHQLFSTCLHMT